MPEPDDTRGGLPEVLRSSDRPIVIYHAGPPPFADAPTSNALAQIFFLSLMTVCLIIAGVSHPSIGSVHGKDNRPT